MPMTQVQFHTLTDDRPADELPPGLSLACRLATDCYRAGQTVFIFTDDETQACRVDEALRITSYNVCYTKLLRCSG